MWTWDYELRTLGSWPSERYNGHNMPVEVVTKADHDAALRRAKAEGMREAAKVCREKASGLEGEADLIIEQGDLSGPSDEYRYAGRELRFAAQALDARAAQIEEGA